MLHRMVSPRSSLSLRVRGTEQYTPKYCTSVHAATSAIVADTVRTSHRSPDEAKIKTKMVYASSKDALRRALVGIASEIQGTDHSEIAYTEGAFLSLLLSRQRCLGVSVLPTCSRSGSLTR